MKAGNCLATFVALTLMAAGCKTDRHNTRSTDSLSGSLDQSTKPQEGSAQVGPLYRVSGKAFREGEIYNSEGKALALSNFFDEEDNAQWPGKTLQKDGNPLEGGTVTSDLYDKNGEVLFPQDLFDEEGNQIFPELDNKISPTTILSGNPDAQPAEVLAGDEISVNTLCTRAGTEGSGTSLLSANSLSIKAYKMDGEIDESSIEMGIPGMGTPTGPGSPEDFELPTEDQGGPLGSLAMSLAAQFSEPVEIVVKGDGKEAIKKIINERSLQVDLSSLEDGQYALILCDGVCNPTTRELAQLGKSGISFMLQPPKGTVGFVHGVQVKSGEIESVKDAKVIYPHPEGLDLDDLLASGEVLRTAGDMATEEEENVAADRAVASFLDREDDLSQGDGGERGDEGQDGDGRGDEGQDGDGRGDEGQDGDGRGDDVQISQDDCDEISDPLIISLDFKSSIELSAPLSGVEFDIDADGHKEKISWVTSASDMFLILDVNKNGIVDNGSELFSNFTVIQNGKTASHGFSALSVYDTNQDNKIDKNDEVYAQLRLWSDKNFDGQSSKDELYTLSSQEVSSIELHYNEVDQRDKYHNAILQTSTAIVKGKKAPVYDVWFRTINVKLEAFATWLRK